MSRSSPRFKFCKSEKLPAFYFECFNSPDNCSSTYCPFCLSTSGSSLRHFRDAVHVLPLLNSVQWSLFIFSSARFYPLFTCLGILFPFCAATRLSFPCLCVVPADWGSLRAPPWEPCVGECHCFRQRRAWPHPDSRRSSDHHPLHMVPGPLNASVYCTLLKHWLVWHQSLTHCLSVSSGWRWKVASGGEWPRVCSPHRRQGSENSPVRRCWKAVLQLGLPRSASVSPWGT